jgi:hypothetical protein
MIHRGQLVMDAPMDSVKEQYRYVQAVFPEFVTERDFWLPGIERVRTEGRTVSLVASRNVDDIANRLHFMRAHSVEVLPISLKEIFLEKVKAGK